MSFLSSNFSWWQRTALRLKELDWLQILGLVAIPTISLLVGGMTYLITEKQGKATLESQSYEVMSSYYDQMRELVINGKLLDSPNDNVKSLTKTITLSAFRQLDGKRRGEILKSLYDMKLVGKCEPDFRTREVSNCRIDSVVSLTNARLDQLKFDENISLAGINLSDTWLLKADLKEIDLSKANLAFARLNDARMDGAELKGANLSTALLQKVSLKGAKLQNVDLRRADLEKAELQNTDLRRACLQGTNLKGANLYKADLTGAEYDSQTIFPDGFDKNSHGLNEVNVKTRSQSLKSSCS